MFHKYILREMTVLKVLASYNILYRILGYFFLIELLPDVYINLICYSIYFKYLFLQVKF